MKLPDNSALEFPKHKRLFMNQDKCCRVANIQTHHLHTHLDTVCDEGEMVFFNSIFHSKNPGYIYETCEGDIIKKMKLIAGFLIRNERDARVWSFDQLFHSVDEGLSLPTCVLLPSFYVHEFGDNNIPKWKLRVLMDWLSDMDSGGKRVFLYIDNRAGMKVNYGSIVEQFIYENYQVIR